jgi:RND family efflux transporter MFP subunit
MIRHLFLLLACTVAGLSIGNLTAYGEPVAEVTTTALQNGSLPIMLHVYGRVEARSDARQTIMAPLAATIEDVFVRQGAEVAKGAPLVTLAPSPEMASSYSKAQTALHVAKDLVRRTQKMVKAHLATAQQLAQAQQSKSDAEVTLAALKKQGAVGPSILRAPFAAVVTTVPARPGAIIAEGAPLVDLSRPEGLVLQAGVVPEQALAIAYGNDVRITPIGGRQSYAGKVLLRGDIADPNTGLVPVEISLPAGKFISGESAEAKITTGLARGVIVPHAAILVDEKGGNYVVQAVGGKAKTVVVQILAESDNKDIITGKLDMTAPLVVTGNYQLEEGMKLRVDPPTAQKDAP